MLTSFLYCVVINGFIDGVVVGAGCFSISANSLCLCFLREKGLKLAQTETDVYFCLYQLASNAKIKKTDASADIEKRRK